jgi:hypothetical protein
VENAYASTSYPRAARNVQSVREYELTNRAPSKKGICMIQTNSSSGVIRSDHSLGLVKAASTITLLAGAWLFVSPWIYGAYANATAWNSWIVGALIFLFGLIRVGRPAFSIFSWFNMVLGAWVFCSPWIYNYASTNTGRFINSLCVGVIVFVVAIVSARVRGSRMSSPTQNL